MPGAHQQQGLSGGYVAQLARSVGVYGKPIPRSVRRARGGGAGGEGGSRDGGSGAAPIFSDKERAVIANLEEYTADGLQQLNESLRVSCAARMDEVKEARAEKRQLQEDLADTLARLADTQLASQGALRAGRNDRLFLKQVVAKYRTLVEHYEMEKQQADLSDPDGFNAIRRVTVKLHENMHAAQGLSKILDDIEKMRTSIVQLETLLSFHKTDLRIVHAGSKQVLAKAQGHKDALFQALVGLESRLVKARSQREERSKELRVSKQQHEAMSQRLQEEEQAVLEREVVWLQEQLNSARHASKDGYSPRSKSDSTQKMIAKLGSGGGSMAQMAVGERGGLQVQSLKLQIDQLERELQELRADARSTGGGPRPGGKPRPPTANVDGRDRARQREARGEELRSQLSDLREELASSPEGKGGREKLELMADISALEQQLETQHSESDIWDEHDQMASELQELEGLLAEREASGLGIESLAVIKRRESAVSKVVALEQRMRDSRGELRQALDKAMSLCQMLSKQVSEGSQIVPDDELEGIEKSLKDSLAEATRRAREADETVVSIETLLPIAEGTSNARMPDEEMGESQGEKDHGALEKLRHEHAMLEKSVRHRAETNALTQLKLTRLKALLNSSSAQEDGTESGPKHVVPPRLHAGAKLPLEQNLRKRLAEEKQARGGKRSPRDAGSGITSADVAELSALWHMEQGDAPLAWIASKALNQPLPLGWEEHQDEGGHSFYVETASGVSSYEHPNDVKYKGIYVEVKNYLDQMQAGGQLEVYGMTADSLEAERLRLREVDALIEKQEEDLRRKEEAMQQEHLLAAISQEETAGQREAEWEKRRDEVLKAEVNRLRHNEGLKLQEAREHFVVELREQHIEKERAAIRKMLEDEAEVKLRAERLRVREKLLKEEMLAARRDMELQEKVSLQDERQAMREEIMKEVKEQRLEEMGVEESERASAVSQLAQETEKIRLQTEQERDNRKLAHQDRVDELEEYAKYLGMDPARKDLLWVAQLALTAPLPAGWSEHEDAKGNVFFYCHATNASTYQHPMDNAFKAYYDKLEVPRGDM